MKPHYPISPVQRRKLLNVAIPNCKISYIVDPNFNKSLPDIKINNNAIEIHCSEFIKFNMERRDDSSYWDHFYDVFDIPKTTEVPE